MRVVEFLIDSAVATETGERLAELVAARPESVDSIDLGAAENRADAQREAMLSVGAATRIGGKPDALFDDDDGSPDFSAGAIVVEEETGRRDLYVGTEAVELLTEQ